MRASQWRHGAATQQQKDAEQGGSDSEDDDQAEAGGGAAAGHWVDAFFPDGNVVGDVQQLQRLEKDMLAVRWHSRACLSATLNLLSLASMRRTNAQVDA